MEKGTISVNQQNMFPIIKKWLYSDKDIFLREVVSNGVDAITKLKQLVSIGEAQAIEGEYAVRVIIDRDNGTLTIKDNGIGMTAEEVKKYINQVAFSGATDFIDKYMPKSEPTKPENGEEEREGGNDDRNDIIGHFGLGFYSVFMVSDHVAIETKSWKDEPAVRWDSDTGMDYEMTDCDKTTVGSDIILHIAEDSKEFLQKYEVSNVLRKYCSFLPLPIYLEDIPTAAELAEKAKEAEEKAKEAAENAEKGEAVEEPTEEEKEEAPSPINDINPLYTRRPSECTEDEYKDFYRDTFFDYKEPLFWIHLNVEYPFRLKGILYFPRLNGKFDTIEGKVKLYCNQVFVADNVKEVIPEFLLLLKGVIDCPDLPLNVSRSFLQNDGYVKKITKHITKKVADKLIYLYNNEREAYESYWDDINPFVKYGCIKESRFYDSVKDILIYKDINGKYISLSEYKEQAADKTKVYYVSDARQQSSYIEMFKANGINAIILDSPIDINFINFMEMHEEGLTFHRVDTSINDSFKQDNVVDVTFNDAVTKCFKDSMGDKVPDIEITNLKTEDVPAILTLSEEAQRYAEMAKMWGDQLPDMPFPNSEKLILNGTSPVVKKLAEGCDDELTKLVCNYVYYLAKLANRPLTADEMKVFAESSNAVLKRLLG